jgi:putative Mg2+ transporter-C (MgtC) family protein
MNQFFGLTIDASTGSGMGLVLLFSVLLGGLIGMERELHGHPAGLRTHILVCLGSTLITLVSVHTGNGDGRIAAQIVSGIGFLGAGAIIREGASVRGLTTAASVWATAGIGIALGTSPFFGQIATEAAVIVLFTLWILNFAEDWIDVRGNRWQTIQVELHDSQSSAGELISCLADFNVSIHSLQFEGGKERHTRIMVLRVILPRDFNRAGFLRDVANHPSVLSVNLP